MRRRTTALAIGTAVLSLFFSWVSPSNVVAEPYFEDGLLGLTQNELHEKLGLPQAVRDRKSALRVFTYYPITDWATYYSKLVSPENGEDVYTFTRHGMDIRYSFSYAVDPNDYREDRRLVVRLVDIEFPRPVSLSDLPSLIPEFRPSVDSNIPAFRSNIWILLFKGSPREEARFIVKEHTKDQLDWTLCYQLFSLAGLPEQLTATVPIDRIEISAQSLRLVSHRQQYTHEPTLNPYSLEFERQLSAPDKPTRAIPVPQYAE
ncbi:MAG: hypothetical protein OEY86_01860 [Nitrospira sp.]|nr:hypothetical protein [Nitrospira sp.]